MDGKSEWLDALEEERELLEETNNGLQPDDPEQDVSQSIDVSYDEEGNEVK